MAESCYACVGVKERQGEPKRVATMAAFKSPGVVRRATFVAIVVGTLLNLINNYGVFLGEASSLTLAMKMGLTYIVPYGVSSYSQAFLTP